MNTIYKVCCHNSCFDWFESNWLGPFDWVHLVGSSWLGPFVRDPCAQGAPTGLALRRTKPNYESGQNLGESECFGRMVNNKSGLRK